MKKFFVSLLTDKSFWAAAAALVSCVLVALNVPQDSAAQITSLIGGLGTIVAYMIENGITTAARIRADAQVRAAEALRRPQ